MQLNQLRFLVTIAQCGSINKAAEKLFVSQPAISTAIQALEEELGVQLLKRTKLGTRPTEYGVRIIRDANKLFHTMESWNYLADSTTEDNVVRIFYYTSFSSQPMFNFYFLMKQLHPEIEIRLIEHRLPTHEIDTDNAIIHTCSTESLNEIIYNSKNQYRVSKLFEDCFCLFVSIKNPLADEARIKITDIAGLDIIGKESNAPFPLRNVFRDLQCKRVFLGDNANILRAVSKDYGIALLPSSLALDNPYVTSGQVCCRSFSDSTFPLYHYLLSPMEKVLTANESIVYNCMRTFYADIMTTSEE